MQDNTKFYPIKGFEGEYEITKSGTVRSVERYVRTKNNGKQLRPGKTIKPHITNKGYYRVSLSGRKRFSIHRLLAINFIPNPNNYEIINHKNGVKTDNRLENLEWCDYYHNNKQTYALGFINNNRVVPDSVVRFIRFAGIPGKNSNCRAIADYLGYSSTIVKNIVYGKTYKEIV